VLRLRIGHVHYWGTSDSTLVFETWTKAWTAVQAQQGDEELKKAWGADDPFFKGR